MTETADDARSAWTLAAALLGFFVVTFDAVVVNVALPSIRDDLGGGISGLQWVVDGYTLMFAGLLLTSGAVSDRFGARRAFGFGLALFVAASIACGLAPSMGVLVLARFVQGSAAAIMMPASMALIGQAYPDARRRAWAVGMWAMGGAIASSSAPVMGGLLSLASWRWIFFINVPVGAVALVLLTRVAVSPRRWRPFDWVGQCTAVLAMGGLTYGAIEAGSAGITSPQVIVAFTIAIVAFAAFVLAQARVSHPMVPLELFRSRDVSVAVAVGFAFVVGYYGLPFVMSLHLQQLRGLSSFEAGMMFLPMMIVGALLTPFSSRITERFGARTLITAGLLLMAAGLTVLAAIPASASYVALALLMVPVGLAGPLIMPPITALLLNSVPDAQAGTASGVFNTSRQVGGALAVAVFGALLAGDDFMSGLRLSLLIGAGSAVIAAGTALSLRRPDRTHLSNHALLEGLA
jgi:DHA2 family methylenomycin A resistance protein-like MFS transporter